MFNELVGTAADRDALRWDDLTRRLHPWIDRGHRLAAAYLGDWAAAEDVVQDALLKSWRGWDGLRDQDKLGPWFLQIVVNECRRSSRRMRRWLPFVETAHDGPEADVVIDQDIRRALRQLNPDQRMVILTHFYLDLTLVETAAVLGMPLGTVKSRLDRALARMRGLLAVEG